MAIAAMPPPTIAMCTRLGKIKRVDLGAFVNIRSSGLICMTLAEGDELSYVRLTERQRRSHDRHRAGPGVALQRIAGAADGPHGHRGVRAMRMKKQGDYIAGMEVVEPSGLLLTVTERGYGKCTTLDEYSVKGRGGGGMRTMSDDAGA